MTSLPENIIKFITSRHVLSLSTYSRGTLWAANCFYVPDTAFSPRLIILSSQKTQHGIRMSESPAVAGTICGQPEKLRDICGVQFTARAEHMEQGAAKEALQIYTKRHPVAKLFHGDVWSLWLETVKYTDNRYVFGQKTYWEKKWTQTGSTGLKNQSGSTVTIPE